MRDADCVLCGDLSDRGGRIDIGHGLALTSDAAPLLPGHALLHTFDHVPSFAAISTDTIALAFAAIERVIEIGRFAAGPVLAFEHGTLGPSGGSGCVDHAHIHLLPLGDAAEAPGRLSIPEALVKVGSELDPNRLGSLAGTPYFWIAERASRLRIIVPRQSERQVLRRIVAEALGLPAYRTWDLYDSDAANATMAELRSHEARLTGERDAA